MVLRAVGCPGLSSIFCCRSSAAPGQDLAVLDVARAIYLGGRAGGARGLDVVAHVIQNRCRHRSFPSEPLDVVHAESSAAGDQFAYLRSHEGDRREVQSAAERQLLGQARRLAARLMLPPRRLSSTDPTDGALYFDPASPADAYSALAPVADVSDRAAARPRAADAGEGGGRRPEAQRSAGGSDLEDHSEPQSEDDVGDMGSPQRPQLPPKSCQPFSFLRGRGCPPAGSEEPGSSSSGVPPSPCLPRNGLGLSFSDEQPALRASPPRSPREEAAATASGPALAGASPAGLAHFHAEQQQRPAHRELSRMGPRRMQRSVTGHGGPGLRDQSPMRPLTLAGLRRSPADDDEGYHDMILPCGLLQDQVIDIMYRDLSPEDFEMLGKLDDSLPKRNIVQRNLVDSLPRMAAKDSGCGECGVCLAELEASARVLQLPCGHAFHPTCISRWLTQCKNTCPLCFKLIDPEAATRSVSSPEEDLEDRERPCCRYLDVSRGALHATL